MSAEALERMVDRDISLFENPRWRPGALGGLASRYAAEASSIARIVESVPGYAPTPCYPLPRLAAASGSRTILFKDEGARFGLGSFKSIGVVYAMVRHLERFLGKEVDPCKAFRKGYEEVLQNTVFATATSGNHGRAVAWASRCIGARCVIYAPRECSEGRIAEMERYGAEVVRTGLFYNAAMALCRKDCEARGWTIFSDTSWKGYEEIPTDIMLGYAHIISELDRQVGEWREVTHLVVQGGVGAFAAGLVTGLSAVDSEARIDVIVVEPRNICALKESARIGAPASIKIGKMSLMTGISNEEASVVAWPVLQDRVRWFAELSDEGVRPCLRFFRAGGLDATPIEMGETATAGITAWISLLRSHRGALGAMPGAIVFGCEGVTDRSIYERLVSENPTTQA